MSARRAAAALAVTALCVPGLAMCLRLLMWAVLAIGAAIYPGQVSAPDPSLIFRI